jgi:hypothetical protein
VTQVYAAGAMSGRRPVSGGLVHDPTRRTQGAISEGQAARGPMGDLQPFAQPREHRCMFADDVACADGFESYRLAIALAGLTLAAVDSALFQVAPERARDHLAHAQRGARGRICLVAMMRLDDFNIDRIAQHARGGIDQLEAQVDAGAHVGRQHDGDILRRHLDLSTLRGAESGSADHHPLIVLAADRNIVERCFWPGEVDYHVDPTYDNAQTGLDRDAEFAYARGLAGVRPDQGAIRVFNSRREIKGFIGLARLDERPAHAPASAVDADLNGLA